MRPVLTGSPSFTLVSGADYCGSQVSSGGSCDIAVQFVPDTGHQGFQQAVLSIAPGMSSGGAAVQLSGTAAVLNAGQVSATTNPQVAEYSITAPVQGTWSVRFGLTTDYDRFTSPQAVAAAGTTASMFVAGMLPNTTYHMQATMTSPDGTTVADQDHIFTTGALPPGIPATLPVTLGVTGTPQSGIELVNGLFGSIPSTIFAIDLQGNVIWTYPFTDRTSGTELYPGKLFPNGDFVVFLCPPSYPLGLPGSNIMREIDLAGNTVRELTMDDLNSRLATAGFSVTLANYSHDFVLLPNGHFLILANSGKTFTDLPGYPGETNVAGDVVVDLDPNWNPVWIWNSFDHLDINRHPWNFPDWTHANSVAYSTDDGNFIISLRHQNWVLKIDYRDGQGTGNILWRLGEGGDFKLKGGVDPTDWFYAQHDVRFETQNTTGVFTLGVMDNGDDRIFPPGDSCGIGNDPPCLYSTIQRLQIDEAAKTATLEFHQILPSYLYSNWGGNTEDLANGNVEYELAGPSTGSQVFEVTNEKNPKMVWNAALPGNAAYRAYRIPSLYPGAQW